MSTEIRKVTSEGRQRGMNDSSKTSIYNDSETLNRRRHFSDFLSRLTSFFAVFISYETSFSIQTAVYIRQSKKLTVKPYCTNTH